MIWSIVEGFVKLDPTVQAILAVGIAVALILVAVAVVILALRVPRETWKSLVEKL